jgi:hypothetical protein
LKIANSNLGKNADFRFRELLNKPCDFILELLDFVVTAERIQANIYSFSISQLGEYLANSLSESEPISIDYFLPFELESGKTTEATEGINLSPSEAEIILKIIYSGKLKHKFLKAFFYDITQLKIIANKVI